MATTTAPARRPDSAAPTSVISSLCVFGLFTVLMFPIHEFAHYSTYRALGIHVQVTLNTASPSDEALRRPIAEIAGPLLNLGVAAVAGYLYLRGRSRKRWLAELALAATMMRLVIYILVVGAALATGSGLSLGNDEPIAAQLWGLPSLTFVAIFALPFAWIAATVAKTAWGYWRLAMLHLVMRGVVMLGVGILVGNVLDPWLFP